MRRVLSKGPSWITAIILMAGGVLHGSIFQCAAAGATRAANAIWVHDQLYDTIATPTSFRNAPEHSTDIIFSFDGSGLTGQRSVAEAAPGDPDYNGGRWRVMAIVFTDSGLMAFDSDQDGVIDFEITAADAVLVYAAAGLLEIVDTGIRFECPLLPRRSSP